MTEMSSDPSDQQTLHVGYLGPEASFSHQAAIETFPEVKAECLTPLASFEAILSAIQKSSPLRDTKDGNDDDFDYVLIPLENSTNGGVVPVLDLLVQCGQHANPSVYPDIEIVAEHYLTVHHNLFCHKSIVDNAGSKDLKDLNIKVLYSHPQVWGQCGRFLAANLPLPDVERIHTSSTSMAAAYVAHNSMKHDAGDPSRSNTTASAMAQIPKASKEGNIAAICSLLAGERYGLVNLASNIEDEPGKNTTRFLILRNRHRRRSSVDHDLNRPPTSPSSPTISWKSLITFTIPHKMPGSLAAALTVFSKYNSNLTTITTRPSREQPWHYVFFVECEEARTNNHDDSKVNSMLKELATLAERCTLLGSWVDRLKHPFGE